MQMVDRDKFKNKTGNSIIKVILNEDDEKILNLNTSEGLERLNEYINQIFEVISNYNYKAEDEHKSLCFILDLVKFEFDIEIVIYTFEKKNPKYSNIIILLII